MGHAVPFMKASNVTGPARAPKDVPDLEEAIEEEDEGELVEPKEEDEEGDIKADKYIKQPKAKGKRATKKKGDDDDDVAKPKGRAKKGATRGKGKK